MKNPQEDLERQALPLKCAIDLAIQDSLFWFEEGESSASDRVNDLNEIEKCLSNLTRHLLDALTMFEYRDKVFGDVQDYRQIVTRWRSCLGLIAVYHMQWLAYSVGPQSPMHNHWAVYESLSFFGGLTTDSVPIGLREHAVNSSSGTHFPNKSNAFAHFGLTTLIETMIVEHTGMCLVFNRHNLDHEYPEGIPDIVQVNSSRSRIGRALFAIKTNLEELKFRYKKINIGNSWLCKNFEAPTFDTVSDPVDGYFRYRYDVLMCRRPADVLDAIVNDFAPCCVEDFNRVMGKSHSAVTWVSHSNQSNQE